MTFVTEKSPSLNSIGIDENSTDVFHRNQVLFYTLLLSHVILYFILISHILYSTILHWGPR